VVEIIIGLILMIVLAPLEDTSKQQKDILPVWMQDLEDEE
jgi:hypothetical protein